MGSLRRRIEPRLARSESPPRPAPHPRHRARPARRAPGDESSRRASSRCASSPASAPPLMIGPGSPRSLAVEMGRPMGLEPMRIEPPPLGVIGAASPSPVEVARSYRGLDHRFGHPRRVYTPDLGYSLGITRTRYAVRHEVAETMIKTLLYKRSLLANAFSQASNASSIEAYLTFPSQTIPPSSRATINLTGPQICQISIHPCVLIHSVICEYFCSNEPTWA